MIVRRQTNFHALNKTDCWASMILQETLADIFGLLLSATQAWQNGLTLTRSMLSQVYVWEMLRYLRRSPCDFPDAGAAFVQLSYMLQKGYAVFDGTRIMLSSQSLIDGLTMLAKTLTECLLVNDIETTMCFASQYCPHLNAIALDKIKQMVGRSTHTLDYIQPIYQAYDIADETHLARYDQILS